MRDFFLTPELVRRRVERIRKAQVSDYEAAHAEEDTMHVLVLKAIADGHPQAKELAEAALESCCIDFPRYCA